MEYKETDMKRRAKYERLAQEVLLPHLLILRYIRKHLEPSGAVEYNTTFSIYRLVMSSLTAFKETRYAVALPLLTEVRIDLQEKDDYN